jgi:hypothetical protein
MAGSTPRPPGYWDAVKDDYFGGVKLRDIYRHHECTKGEFDHHRREANWPVRNKSPVNRERMVGRIFWLVNKHIAALEKNIDAGSHADVAVLNQLVGSLGRLIRFEAGSVKAASKRERGTSDLKDIREKLVRRIEELKRD